MLERYKESYKSITAGDELKGRILGQAKENFRKKSRERIVVARRYAVAMAACLALVACIGIALGSNGLQKTQVLYNGEKLCRREAAVTEASARAYSLACASETESGVPLEIKTDVKTMVSVSEGELLIFDGSYDNLIFIGEEFTADKSVLLFWNLSESTEKEPVLTVETDHEKSRYTLSESEKGGYIIKLTVREKKK